MNKTRSFATQCESRRNTGVQTKRLSKDEMRYYANVIEKEKQVLLKFLEATKDQSGMLPRYKINMLPMQAKVMKNYGAKKRQKRKNKRKHSSLKIKHGASQNSDISRQVGENVGNRAHYVSKIVVDDDTRSLKLRFKSCNPRKSSSATEFKENERRMKGEERARSRKAKQPRRVCRVNEFQPDVLTTTTTNEKPTKFPEPRLGTLSPVQLHMSPKRISQAEKPVIKPAPSVKSDCPFASTNSSHRKQTTSMFTPSHSEDEHLSPSRITIKQEGKESEDCFQSIHSRPKRPDPVLAPTPPDDDTWNGHETTANSDDEQSDCSECSEEFSIVEPRDENATKLNESDALNTTDYKSPSDEETTTRKSDASMRDELKKRLKANLIRKQFDDNNNHHHHHNNHHHNNNNQHHKITNSAGEIHPGSEVRVEETEGLPQVVSVHFYDSHNQCQRVIDPNTPISQYARSDSTHLMLDDPISPSNSLSSLHPTGVTSHDSFNQRRSSLSPLGSLVPLTHPQATLPNIRPMQYRYPPYYHHATGMSKQPTTVTYANNLQNNTTSASYQPSYLPQAVSPNIPPGLPKTPPATSPSGSIPVSTPTSTISPTPHTGREQEKAGSPNIAGNSEAESGSRAAKRKRFIFGSHEPPKKKVISSLLTPLCEREATRLADGIHEINMQYFPLRSLAQKAANRVSEDTDDVLKLIEQKIQLKTKVQDVEKARNLLKDIYDMVLKSKEIEDIQNFELVSHNFGVRNILNHLSLVDLYFGELGTELQSKI